MIGSRLGYTVLNNTTNKDPCVVSELNVLGTRDH
jgi:hypothetical protein